MNRFESHAREVASQMVNFQGTPQAVGFSPAMILVLIEVVAEVVQLIKACKKTSAQVHDLSIQPGHLNSWWLRRIIRKHASKNFDGQCGAIYNSVLATGGSMAGSDLHGLIQGE